MTVPTRPFGGNADLSGFGGAARLIAETGRLQAEASTAAAERRHRTILGVGGAIGAGLARRKDRAREDAHRAEARAERDEDRLFRQEEAARDNERANLQLALSMDAQYAEREMALTVQAKQDEAYGTDTGALSQLEQLRTQRKKIGTTIQTLAPRAFAPTQVRARGRPAQKPGDD